MAVSLRPVSLRVQVGSLEGLILLYLVASIGFTGCASKRPADTRDIALPPRERRREGGCAPERHRSRTLQGNSVSPTQFGRMR